MKHFINFLMLICSAVLLQYCTQEDDHSIGSIQFIFDPGKIEDPNGRAKEADFPTGSYLLVSIRDNNGRAVLTRKTVNLVQVGDNFVSDPIPLSPGNYKLTDFWVAGPTNIMLYAVPKEGSPFARFVNRPLPFSFNVSQNILLEEPVHLLDVTEADPEDFGYVSFDPNIVRKFGLSVFIPHKGGLALSTAEAFIIKEDDTIATYSLQAKINTILFAEDRDETLELVVIKDGYSRFSRTFTYRQLKDELEGNPLTVVLAPALTFVAFVQGAGEGPTQYARNFIANKIADGGNLTIDWGDGSTEILPVESSDPTYHTYEKNGTYFVSITGNLELITDLRFHYDDALLTKIDLRHLPELRDFSTGYQTVTGPSILDFTHNEKLEVALLGYSRKLEQIIFPSGLKLMAVDIGGPNNLTAEDVNVVIDYVYQSATEHNIRDGYFNFLDITSGGATGPPSPASIAKLTTLRDDYAWSITLD